MGRCSPAFTLFRCEITEHGISGSFLVCLHHCLKLCVGDSSGFVLPNGASHIVLPMGHGAGHFGGAICRELHPQTVGELVFMDKVGWDGKGFPRGLVIGITIGNLYLNHVLTGIGFEMLTDKSFPEYDGNFFSSGFLRILVFQWVILLIHRRSQPQNCPAGAAWLCDRGTCRFRKCFSRHSLLSA